MYFKFQEFITLLLGRMYVIEWSDVFTLTFSPEEVDIVRIVAFCQKVLVRPLIRFLGVWDTQVGKV